ncbi:MAG: D-alanine--D-alanine ligase [Proteobacteria bacterium]|nr:D-alanine--D-alanine ligase [Pseudomonadota bacterium]
MYDLRDDYLALGFSDEQTAEFDKRETINQITEALSGLGYAVEPIGHGRRLAAALSNGQRWDLVFSIAEGVRGRSREAQVPALCELFDQAYVFSDPLTMAVTLDKAMAKRIVRDCGIATAPFVVLESGSETLADWNHYPAFVKPLAEGTGKGCELASLVDNEAELRAAAMSLILRFGQPALVEAYLPGREFTVGIIGNGAHAHVIGTMEILLNADAEPGVYSYTNKEEWERLVTYRRADDEEAGRAADCALAAYRALGCHDAARLDLRSDRTGTPVFLEANPIAGLNMTHSDLPMLAAQNGITYADLLAMIVTAAVERYEITDRGFADLRASA